jgi:hypothetical protein
MQPLLKKHYQETRETLERYRDMAPVCIWAIVLSYPVGMFLYASGMRFLVVVLLFSVVTASAVQYIFYLREQVEKADVWCECEGYDDYARTPITLAWVCGFCAKTHPPFKLLNSRHTSLDTCVNVNCKARQHSIICFRCRQPIVWDEYAFRQRPNTSAWLPDYPPLAPEPEPVREDRPPRPIDEDLR